jgi:hypothetical protein
MATHNTRDGIEEKYDKLVLELMGQSAFSAYVGSFHHAKIKSFIHQELQKAREEEKTRTIIEDDLIEIAEMIANGNAFDKESGLIWQHVIDEAKRLCLLRDAIQASNHSELDQPTDTQHALRGIIGNDV